MNKKRILYLLLTLVMAIIIFCFSSQESEKSNNLSYQIDMQIWKLLSKKTEETSTTIEKTVSSDNSANAKGQGTQQATSKKNKTKFPVNDKLFHNIDIVVRKTAHVTLYALFAICLTLFVKTYPIKTGKIVIIVMLIGFLYACLDEFNQKMGGTRTGVFKDSLIDTAGCLIGLGCVLGISKISQVVRKEKK